MENNVKNNKKVMIYIVSIILLIVLVISAKFMNIPDTKNEIILDDTSSTINNIDEILEYSGNLIIIVNKNVPFFTEEDFTEENFIKFSDLDKKGRCGVAMANISKDMLPNKNERRDRLDKVEPTGWNDNVQDGIKINYETGESELEEE